MQFIHLSPRSIGRACISLLIIGICASEGLHRFGSQSAVSPISGELENGNPVAWVFMFALMGQVALSLYVQLRIGNWIHAVFLLAGLIGLGTVALTRQHESAHVTSLCVVIVCLGISVGILASQFSDYSKIAVIILVLSTVVSSVLFFIFLPGIMERVLYVVYAAITTYVLNNHLIMAEAVGRTGTDFRS
ncbi:MAG: hypothetical protein AB8B55_19260 [Mariniblastus sp.]